jgi:hypothetical protein
MKEKPTKDLACTGVWPDEDAHRKKDKKRDRRRTD